MHKPYDYIYNVFRLNCAYNISVELGFYHTLSGAKKRIKKDMNRIDPDILEYTIYYIEIYQYQQKIVFNT